MQEITHLEFRNGKVVYITRLKKQKLNFPYLNEGYVRFR